MNVGLLGFGTIGAGVVRLLREHRADITRRAGMPIRLATVADLDVKTDRGIGVKPARLTTDAGAVLRDPAIDVVIELIGGYEPARRFVLTAIEAGKDVVTANKALLAVHGEEIVAAAERRGVRLGFEASVGGGIPILRSLKEGLVADRTTAVYGIVNGTCNHILTTMTREGARLRRGAGRGAAARAGRGESGHRRGRHRLGAQAGAARRRSPSGWRHASPTFPPKGSAR